VSHADNAPRWRVQYRTDGDGAGVHVVTCHLDPLGLPVIVRPTCQDSPPRLNSPTRSNRAYGIEPASGYDVAGLLGLAFPGVPRRRPRPDHRARCRLTIAILALGAIFCVPRRSLPGTLAPEGRRPYVAGSRVPVRALQGV
jgi:hypothetical protein